MTPERQRELSLDAKRFKDESMALIDETLKGIEERGGTIDDQANFLRRVAAGLERLILERQARWEANGGKAINDHR